jgi:hypothetical protein
MYFHDAMTHDAMRHLPLTGVTFVIPFRVVYLHLWAATDHFRPLVACV